MEAWRHALGESGGLALASVRVAVAFARGRVGDVGALVADPELLQPLRVAVVQRDHRGVARPADAEQHDAQG